MKIPQNKIDEIASSIDIVDIISAYTPLRKAGRNFMGRCPFHEEKTPSFSVSQEKGVYHCFGCGKSGNVFTFIMDIDSVTFYEAVKTLADKANIKIEYEYEPNDADRNKIELLYEINNKAGRDFHENLMGRNGAYAKEYLHERGLKEDIIKKFGLGYSLREKDSLYKKFNNDFSTEDLIASGLVLSIGTNLPAEASAQAGEIRDRFRGRLMFPVFNESGKVIAFGGRRMFDEVTDEAKYINSPETKIYNKSKTLYGLNFAKNKIKDTGYVILVEGYMDLISLFQNGIENVVASSGTSLTTLHCKIISRYTKEVVIVYDSDLAGQNASRRAIELIIENGMNVSIIPLPRGDDPDTYIKKHGTDGFISLLNKRQSIIDYIGESYRTRGALESPEGKTEFVREIIGLIAKMRDEIKGDFYIKDIAERFSIYESIIRKELDKTLKLKSRGLTREIDDKLISKAEKDISSKGHPQTLEISLIKMLFYGDDVTKDYIINNLDIKDLNNPASIKIIDYLIRTFSDNKKINIANLFNTFPEGLENKIIGSALLDESSVLEENRNYINDVKSLLNQINITKSYKKLYIRNN